MERNQEPVKIAREIVQKETGAPATEIQVKKIEAINWPDSSLGLPQPGMMYTQVITPGYRITLEYKAKIYKFHTNSGSRVVEVRDTR